MHRVLIPAGIAYSTPRVAAIVLTRATARRVLGAPAGGVAVAAVGSGAEAPTLARGWWLYPADDPPIGPPPMDPRLVVALALRGRGSHADSDRAARQSCSANLPGVSDFGGEIRDLGRVCRREKTAEFPRRGMDSRRPAR